MIHTQTQYSAKIMCKPRNAHNTTRQPPETLMAVYYSTIYSKRLPPSSKARNQNVPTAQARLLLLHGLHSLVDSPCPGLARHHHGEAVEVAHASLGGLAGNALGPRGRSPLTSNLQISDITTRQIPCCF